MNIRKNLAILTGYPFLLLLFSCHQATNIKKNKIEKLSKNDSVITTPCAVVIAPTLHQIDSMKSKSDSIDFYTTADDNMYYTSSSLSFLDSVKLKQIMREGTGMLTFKTKSGQTFKFALDTLYWNIMLFNGKSKPIEADITDIATDFHRYMKQ